VRRVDRTVCRDGVNILQRHPLSAPRAAASDQRAGACELFVFSTGLAIHPGTMLKTPSDHPQLAAVDVRLPTTRGPIGLITLKSRSLSPTAKLFLQSAASVVKAVRSSRPRRAIRA